MGRDALELEWADEDDWDGFVDLVFDITRLDTRPDGTQLVEGRWRRDGQAVGFALELDSCWARQSMEDAGDFLYWGAGTVRSVGAESDGLLALLDRLYGTEAAPGPMRPATRVAVVGFVTDPRLLCLQETHLKLLFESEDPARYAEVYVNVFAQEGRLELLEKDSDYRRPLLRRLALEKPAD